MQYITWRYTYTLPYVPGFDVYQSLDNNITCYVNFCTYTQINTNIYEYSKSRQTMFVPCYVLLNSLQYPYIWSSLFSKEFIWYDCDYNRTIIKENCLCPYCQT